MAGHISDLGAQDPLTLSLGAANTTIYNRTSDIPRYPRPFYLSLCQKNLPITFLQTVFFLFILRHIFQCPMLNVISNMRNKAPRMFYVHGTFTLYGEILIACPPISFKKDS